ncbi:MAG: chemotaxis protein CheX [Spirochaetia bacterium]|nr:chemotaxis protein CheX [Spirochaetia bacterium]
MTVQNPTESETDIEKIIKEINQGLESLFLAKEKTRVILGEFVNSDIVSHNDKNRKVKKYSLTYELDFHGSFGGKILLNIEPEIALYITSLLFGEDLEDPISYVNEAMKETLNIFSGHLVSFFEEYDYDLDIGLPSPSKYDFMKSKPRKKILFRYLSDDHIIQFILEIHKP